MGGCGLAPGSRVAVVGGGVAGWAFALGLRGAARLRGVHLDVSVYSSSNDEAGISPPAVLTAECRSRLAALGLRLPFEWRGLELRAVEVISAGRTELIPLPAGDVWVVDGAEESGGGLRLVTSALRRHAERLGVHTVEARVDAVEHSEVALVTPGATTKGLAPGSLVVRAQGCGQRFHAAALATGASDTLGGHFFSGLEPAPTLPAVHARLRHGTFRLGEATAKLVLNPLPGVDALLLLPCQRTTYALAYGPSVQPADLCQALMGVARDGLLAEGFEICHLAMTRVPAGVAHRGIAPGQVSVGAVALGHPLQLGLAATLTQASRTALALMETGRDVRVLRRRLHEAIADLSEDARVVTSASAWLRRAGPAAAAAFATTEPRSSASVPFSSSILGTRPLAPLKLLQRARWTAIKETVRAWLAPALEPLPTSVPILEPGLFYVVDDDADAREALSELLESRGARVVAFADELALYCAVARRPPTAILLDVVLQWVDGLRLCEGLKQHPLTRATPVIVMSGLNRPHVRRRALEGGAEAFLPKPLEPEMLWKVLASHPISPPTPLPESKPPQAPPAVGYEISA